MIVRNGGGRLVGGSDPGQDLRAVTAAIRPGPQSPTLTGSYSATPFLLPFFLSTFYIFFLLSP